MSEVNDYEFHFITDYNTKVNKNISTCNTTFSEILYYVYCIYNYYKTKNHFYNLIYYYIYCLEMENMK